MARAIAHTAHSGCWLISACRAVSRATAAAVCSVCTAGACCAQQLAGSPTATLPNASGCTGKMHLATGRHTRLTTSGGSGGAARRGSVAASQPVVVPILDWGLAASAWPQGLKDVGLGSQWATAAVATAAGVEGDACFGSRSCQPAALHPRCCSSGSCSLPEAEGSCCTCHALCEAGSSRARPFKRSRGTP